MRAARLLAMFVCALMVQTGVASAHYDWLDKLSGPGPFHGIDIQYRFLCVVESTPLPPEVARIAPPESVRVSTLGFFDQGGGVIPLNAPRERPGPDMRVTAQSTAAAITAYRAQYAEGDCERDINVRGYFALKWGPYRTSENILFADNKNAEIYRARFVQTALKGGWRLWRAVDAVGAVGINRFSGDAFESFWRPSVMAGVAIYPAAVFKDSQLARALMFEFGYSSFLSGFEAADFCQADRLPGLGCRGLDTTFDEGVEFQKHLGVTIDLVFFKWLLGGRID